MRFVLVTISVALVLGSAAGQPVLGGLVSSLGNVVDKTTQTIGQTVDTVGDITENVVETVGDVTGNVLETTGDVTEDVIDLVVDGVLTPITDLLAGNTQDVEATFGDIEAAFSEFEAEIDAIIEAMSQIFQLQEDFFDEILSVVSEASTNTASDVNVEQA